MTQSERSIIINDDIRSKTQPKSITPVIHADTLEVFNEDLKDGTKFVNGSNISDAVYNLGNVGIGINTPTEKLDIDGNVRVRQLSTTIGGNTIIILPTADGTLQTQTINEGQIKLNSSGGVKPSLTGFTANIARFIEYNNGVLNFSSSPTNQVPYNSSDFYNNTTNQFLENPILGSVNIWRVKYTYSGKASGSNVGVNIGLMNPLSGFVTVIPNTLPNGSTSSPTVDFGGGDVRIIQETAIFITIADGASIGTGYKLFSSLTQNDGNFNITIDSVVRSNYNKYIR